MAQAANAQNDAAFSLVDGDVIDRVRRLEMFSRFRVEGFLQGLNASPFKGFSSDFLQHRQYVPGDNLKYLDWRVYGKSEKLYIRQYEELTNTQVSLVLDVSNSMSYQGPTAQLSKHRYAIRCVALLSYLALLRKDSFSLTLFNTRSVGRIPFGSGKKHLHRVLTHLVTTQPGEATDFTEGLGQAVAPITRKGLTVVLSDFMDDPERVVKVISRLRLQGSDVVAMQLFDPSEAKLDFQSITRFHDLEGPDILVLDPQILARQYEEEFQLHQQEMKQACQRYGFDHVALPVAEPFEVPLLEYVRRRMELLS